MLKEDIWLITTREDHFRAMGWTKFEDCQNALAQLEFTPSIMADLETSGLGTFRKEKIRSIQIGLKGKQLVFDVEGGIPMSLFKRPLEEKVLYFQNAYFDLPYIYNEGIFPRKIVDTFITENVLTMGIDFPRGSKARGLANLADKYLGITLDKGLQKDIASGLTSVEHIIYAGRDVIYLEDIYEQQLILANRYGVQKRVEMENSFTLVMAYVEFSGAHIDMDYLYEYVRTSEFEEWQIYQELKSKYGDINWNSPKQVAVVLKEHGIEEIDEKTGNPRTGEEVLVKYPEVPIAVDLLKYRAFSKQVSTYGRRWFGYVQDNGRVHTRFKQIVTTGRMSCGDSGGTKIKPWTATYETDKPFPNLQQLPAKTMRGVIASPKGSVLIKSDFTSQESVILADQSNDPTMRKFFEEDGGDIYCFIGKAYFDEIKDLSYKEIKVKYPEIRDKCKAPALAIPYGGDEYTIAANLNSTVEEGKQLYDMYMGLFTTLPEYFVKCHEFVKTHGYIPNDPLFGGKTFFARGKEYRSKASDKDYWRKYWRERDIDSTWYRNEKSTLGWYFAMDREMPRLGVNYRIQGIGAVMMKLSAIYFYSYIQKNKLHGKVRIVNIVHDELLVECPIKISEQIAKVLQGCMERAGNECLKRLKIKAEPEILTRWKK